MSAVAILGCGYVGLAAGEALAAAGHRVVGVRRSDGGLDAVAAAGLDPVRADVTDPERLGAVPDVDAVVFAASSGRRDAAAARAVYVEGIEATIDAFASRGDPPSRLLYTSSTGVYGDHGGDWVDEDSELRPATPKAEVLLEAETVARRAADVGVEPVVARLGGVYGPGRYRVERYLRGPIEPGYLNLLHREDAGGAIRFLLEAAAPPETVLVVDDEPAWKPALATWLAEQCGVEPPRTVSPGVDQSAANRRRRGQKRCTNDRLRALGYDLAVPTFRTGYRAAVAAADAG